MRKIGYISFLSGLILFYLFYEYDSIKENIEQNSVATYIENTSKILPTEKQIEKSSNDYRTSNKTTNYKAIIEIPSINLKKGIVDATKNFKSIKYAISLDKSSNNPGEIGNYILYAHSGSASNAYFKNLYKLKLDNSIYIYYEGIKYEYKIFNIYDIPKTGKAKVRRNNVNCYITLITCNPKKSGYQIIAEGELIGKSNY